MIFSWLKKKQNVTDPQVLSATVGKIIADYGEFIDNNPEAMVIRDEVRLPHAKEKILAALCFAIASRGTRTELREPLIVSALSLAYFQKGIGNDLYPLGFDFSVLESMSAEESLKMMNSNPSGKDSYDRMLPIVKADTDRILQRVQAAEGGRLA